LGLIPDVGGTTRLTRLIGPGRAKQLIFTGLQIDGGMAANWGLVNEVAAETDLLARGLALAGEMALCAPLAVADAKRVIDQVDDSVTRGLELEASAQNELVQSADFEAAVQAMATKTAPRWQGR